MIGPWLSLWLVACGGPPPAPRPAPPPPARADAVALVPPAPAPLPDAYRHEVGKTAGAYVAIPGGTFRLGAQASDPGAPGHDPAARPDEGPPRDVTLRPFRLMRLEATEGLYLRCLQAGWCAVDDAAPPREVPPPDAPPPMSDRPATGLSWSGAARLCAFVGGRLPTEAEWEAAARGGDGRRFPWGDAVTCGLRGGIGPDPAQGCALDAVPSSADLDWGTAHALVGMGGSVWEWVADVYGPYDPAALDDPRGPASGEKRVQRGGGWLSADPLELRAAARGAMPPDQQLPDVGVRCARDETP